MKVLKWIMRVLETILIVLLVTTAFISGDFKYEKSTSINARANGIVLLEKIMIKDFLEKKTS